LHVGFPTPRHIFNSTAFHPNVWQTIKIPNPAQTQQKWRLLAAHAEHFTEVPVFEIKVIRTIDDDFKT